MLTFSSIEIFRYIRAANAVQLSLEAATKVLSAKEARSTSSDSGFANYIDQTLSSAATLSTWNGILDKCQGVSPAAIDECFTGAGSLWGENDASKSKNGIGWSGAGSQHGFNLDELPFKLYEHDTTDSRISFPLVQYPPLSCQVSACMDSLTEKAVGFVSPIGPAKKCVKARPLCWQNAELVDLDGDGLEDIVAFKSNQALSSQTDSESFSTLHRNVDFIVRNSSANYTGPLNGLGYMDLSRQPNLTSDPMQILDPAFDLAVLGDYDGDGRSDYAVIHENNLTLSLSSHRFRSIISIPYPTDLPSDSASFTDLGTIAIAGRYNLRRPLEAGVALFKTVGNGYKDRERNARYRTSVIGLDLPAEASRLSPSDANFDPDDTMYQSAPNQPLTAPSTALWIRSGSDEILPPPGRHVAPAFADYDANGITEIGWLTWAGGYPANWVAGKVYELSSDPTVNGIFPDPSTFPKHPMEARMNPFAVALDPNDNIHYIDAVDGRSYKILPRPVNHRPTGTTWPTGTTQDPSESVVTVFNSLTLQRVVPDLNAAKALFPIANLWNVPNAYPTQPFADTASCNLDIGAGCRAQAVKLFKPRGMTIGPDGALYIADELGRIIRAAPDASGEVSATSTVRLILGSLNCANSPGSCTPLTDAATERNAQIVQSGPFTPFNSSTFGQLSVNPIALTWIPATPGLSSASDPYHLVFSDHFGVYIIENPTASGGPIGQSGETLYRLAGSHSQPTPVGSDQIINWRIIADGTGPASPGLCPVVALAANPRASSHKIYAASSCSKIYDPSGLTLSGRSSSDGTFKTAGGIISIYPRGAGSGLSFNYGVAKAVEVELGNFKTIGDTLFSSGDGTQANPFQRKVKVEIPSSFDPYNYDVMNPTSLVVDYDDTVIFTDQWQSRKFLDDYGRYYDAHYRHAIYRLIPGSGVVPITNPLSYGSHTIPLESPLWFAPKEDSLRDPYIRPWEDSTLNSPIPATGALALNYNIGEIYVSAPYIKPTAPNGIAEPYDPPYDPAPHRLGTIWSIKLDADEDGLRDYAPAEMDKDGDGITDATESSGSAGERYCSQLAGEGCRPNDLLKLPTITAASFTSAEPIDGSINIAGSSSEFLEYTILHSVSGYVSTPDPTVVTTPNPPRGSRPQPWATILDIGYCNDPSPGMVQRCNSLNSNRNGPIVSPMAQNAMVGDPGASFPTTWGKALFPRIMSSFSPIKSGIRPTRGRLSPSSGFFPMNPGFACPDLSLTIPKFSFTLDPLGTYLERITPLGSFALSDPVKVESNCSMSVAPALTRHGNVVSEGIILGIDQDHPQNFPPEGATGIDSTVPDPIQNVSALYFLDLDGDGIRDPAWLGRQSEFDLTDPLALPPQPSINNPTMLTSCGLSHADYAGGRYPFADPLFLNNGPLGIEAKPPGFPLLEYWNPPFATFGCSGFDAQRSILGYGQGMLLALNFEPYFSAYTAESLTSNARDSDLAGTINNKSLDPSSSGGICDTALGVVKQAACKSLAGLVQIRGVAPDIASLDDTKNLALELYPTGCDSSRPCNEIRIGYRQTIFGVPRVIERRASFIKDPLS